MAVGAREVDVIVIGAGIAGASVAAELAGYRSVILLEAESHPGYHATGRSAAIFSTTYGPSVIRALSRASEAYLRGSAPEAQGSVLSPRGLLLVARDDQRSKLDAMAVDYGDAVQALEADELRALVPILRYGYAVCGLHEAAAADLDVNALHQHYLKRFRAAGGELSTNSTVTGLTQVNEMWEVETRVGLFRAPVVVNAAGAWADQVGALAGATAVGLVPKRRTAVLVAPPADCAPDAWPLTVDADEEFYLKPDAGKLLISPADATQSPPCDAQPEDLDVAITVERIETAFDLAIRRVDHKWAGLRSFLPDGAPVAAFDPKCSGFFWLAGQGGYGLQTAPALGRTAAALILDAPVPEDIVDAGVDPVRLAHRGLRG